MARATPTDEDRGMQVIQARRRGAPAETFLPIAAAVLVGALLLGLGLAATYVALTTPVIITLSRLGQGRIGAPLGGTLVWALAFLVPGALIVLGVGRLATAIERGLALRGGRSRPVASLARSLPDEYSVAEGVRLPDRRLVPEIVVGPHGILVVEELPPPWASRSRGPYWEIHLRSGRWMPIENPLERAARDAERVRSWLNSEEEDFSPRMYAAVIAQEGQHVDRTNEVAVLTADQIPAFLAAIPPSRHMTPERRERIAALLREAL